MLGLVLAPAATDREDAIVGGIGPGAGAVLEIWVGEERFEFEGDSVVIGRGEGCDLRLDDARISRRHIEIRGEEGTWRVIDLASANGTFAAGQRVAQLAVRRPTEVFLADPDSGVCLRILPFGSSETITITPGESTAGEIRIGRARDNDLVVDDQQVSRYHAEFRSLPNGTGEIRDCGSANGTRVNGEPIDIAEVAPGTLIEVGDTTLRVAAAGAHLELQIVAEGATLHPPKGDRGSTPPAAPTELHESVTDRERQLIALVAGGASDKEIAAGLFISIATVRSHLDRIQQKTGRRRRADLTRLAFELGLEPRTPVRG